MMEGDEFKAIIARLGMTQVGTARFLQLRDRSIRRWIKGDQPVPHIVEMLLRVMVRHHLSPDTVLSLVKGKRD